MRMPMRSCVTIALAAQLGGGAIVGVFAGVLVGGCHARHIESQGSAGRGDKERATPPQDQRRKAGRPPAAHATPQKDGTEKKDDGEKVEGTDVSTPVASSAGGLLHEGAEADIQEKLEQGGYLKRYEKGRLDGPTQVALRRFQTEHDLPGTGMPDHETLRKLGLDPKRLFRATKAPEKAELAAKAEKQDKKQIEQDKKQTLREKGKE